MITLSGKRIKGQETLTMTARVFSVEKALEMFVLYELGYGGQVTLAEPTKIVVETPIMGDKDVDTFEGDREEMELLLEAAWLSVEFRSRKDMQDAAMREVIRMTAGNPRLLALGGAMYAGQTTLRAILLAMIAGTSVTNEEEAEVFSARFAKTGPRDLFAVVALTRIDHYSIDDITELLEAA